ncbi:hypothetical protein [Rhodoferax sp.]|uniref:hypothetical protein n=1 Tax=Rhodoferax sp. TaxID=50421 RepID=UPI0025D3F894|nr:hypothetical protein [Rhodoferax sp.]
MKKYFLNAESVYIEADQLAINEYLVAAEKIMPMKFVEQYLTAQELNFISSEIF